MPFADLYTDHPESLPESVAAAIFDCDGTLVDTSQLYYRAFNAAVGTCGAEMSRAWFAARLGRSRSEILRQFEREFDILLVPSEAAEKFNNAFRGGLGSLEEIEIIAGVARRCHDRVPIAVASGGTRDIVRTTLHATGLLGLFEVIVTIEDVGGRGKPAPDLFLGAARRMGVRWNVCTVFEDSNEGIEAARRAGMRAVDVRPFYRPAWLSHEG